MSERQAKIKRRQTRDEFRAKIARVREGLLPAPRSILNLPVDERGYFVPWFATELPGGKYDFRVVDSFKTRLAISKDLSFITGAPLTRGERLAFVLGPMCLFNGVSAEPPSNYSEAKYAARVCPFLAIPSAGRREAGLDELPTEAPPGLMVSANPGVVAVVLTRGYRVDPSRLLRFERPSWIEWYHKGEKVDEAEVLTPGSVIMKALDAAEVKLFELSALDPDPRAAEVLERRVAFTRALVRAFAERDSEKVSALYKENQKAAKEDGFLF